MSDHLQQFHDKNLARDPQYAVARQLLELGGAVMQLRESARLTRSQLGKLLRVKARDIEVVEEETPLAPAGLLEAALCVLVLRTAQPPEPHQVEVVGSLRRVRQLRPCLLAA